MKKFSLFNKKGLSALVACSAITLGFAGVTAFAETTVDWNGTTKTLTFSTDGATDGAAWDGSNFTSNWHDYKTTCEHAVFEDGVTELGTNVLATFTALQDVQLPATLSVIGDGAFYKCSSLTSINIPSTVTSIGYRAFRESGLTGALTLPDSLTSLGTNVFQNTNITSVNFPAGLTTIPGECFNGTKLTNVTIPSTVTTLGTNCFKNISTLESLHVDGTVVGLKNQITWGAAVPMTVHTTAKAAVAASKDGAKGATLFQQNYNPQYGSDAANKSYKLHWDVTSNGQTKPFTTPTITASGAQFNYIVKGLYDPKATAVVYSEIVE